MFKIVSMNVRGLQNDNKRKQMFMFCRKLEADVIFMQETHSIKDDEVKWNLEWGSKILFAHHSSTSRGIAVLFKKRLNYEVTKITQHEEGQYLIIDCIINEKELVLVNLYSPNRDEPEFFTKVFELMAKHCYSDCIIGGDFNLILNEKLDSMNHKNNNALAKNTINMYVEQAMLIDPWREQNPKKFKFTWHRKRPKETFARLDFFLINHGLSCFLKNIKHIPSYKSDHSIVMMEIDLYKNAKRGKGFWKLNESILRNKESLQQINNVIDAIIEKTSDYEECIRWEKIKEISVNTCKKISTERAKKLNLEFNELQYKITQANERMLEVSSHQEKEVIESEIDQVKSRLEKYLQYKVEGARIRSRTIWYEKGERSSKFFLGLEKIKHRNKTLNAIKCEDNMITRDEKKILQEQAKFYKKLYSKDPNVKCILENVNVKHSRQDQEILNAPFTFEEFTASLKSMAKGKHLAMTV